MVTGATGFVGRALVDRLAADPRFVVRAASRSTNPGWPKGVEPIQVEDLGGSPDYAEALRGVSCLIHAAARVHVSAKSVPDADTLASFHSVNVAGTRRLAEQAAHAGVRRFIFVSSIKVNGTRTEPGEPFRMSDIPKPQCAYGISKWQAEQALWQVAGETGLEVVVVRPPLAYGSGVKANVLRLMRLVDRGWPLPLAAVDNRRSLVALDNLVFLLYPHRPTQEGFEAFLRTILKFTGKMLLIALSLLSLLLWAPAAAAITAVLPFHVSVAGVFLAGIVFGIIALAAGAVGCVISAFRRFDPSLHALG